MRYSLLDSEGREIMAGEETSRHNAVKKVSEFIFMATPHHIRILLKRTPDGFDVYQVTRHVTKKRVVKYTYRRIFSAKV